MLCRFYGHLPEGASYLPYSLGGLDHPADQRSVLVGLSLAPPSRSSDLYTGQSSFCIDWGVCPWTHSYAGLPRNPENGEFGHHFGVKLDPDVLRDPGDHLSRRAPRPAGSLRYRPDRRRFDDAFLEE